MPVVDAGAVQGKVSYFGHLSWLWGPRWSLVARGWCGQSESLLSRADDRSTTIRRDCGGALPGAANPTNGQEGQQRGDGSGQC